jgi:hypothetical protein
MGAIRTRIKAFIDAARKPMIGETPTSKIIGNEATIASLIMAVPTMSAWT